MATPKTVALVAPMNLATPPINVFAMPHSAPLSKSAATSATLVATPQTAVPVLKANPVRTIGVFVCPRPTLSSVQGWMQSVVQRQPMTTVANPAQSIVACVVVANRVQETSVFAQHHRAVVDVV